MNETRCGIDGVRLLELVRVPDSRGSFLELFRMKWLEDLFTDQVQVNCSISRAGVLRGMHYHERQWDLWVPVRGNMNVGLADLRRDSATHGTAVTLRMGGDDPRGLLIPPGVAHGYAALSDIILIYVVNRYYDGTDEFGTAWDDPALGIEWGLKDPLLSERDRDNPGTGW